MNGDILVTFDRPFEIWRAGETAGFNKQGAEYLVITRKVASYVKSTGNKQPKKDRQSGVVAELQKD
jgi:hypothetical protein